MQKSAVAAYARTELQNLVIVLRRLVWRTPAIVVLNKKIAAGTGNCLRVPSRFIAGSLPTISGCIEQAAMH